jgi:hypothetical protein
MNKLPCNKRRRKKREKYWMNQIQLIGTAADDMADSWKRFAEQLKQWQDGMILGFSELGKVLEESIKKNEM